MHFLIFEALKDPSKLTQSSMTSKLTITTLQTDSALISITNQLFGKDKTDAGDLLSNFR